MSNVFSKPKTPDLPKVAKAPPAPTEQQVEGSLNNQALLDEKQKARAKGSVATFLTGQKGLSDVGGVVSSKLLGG